MRRFLLAALVLAGSIVLTAAPAAACSCAPTTDEAAYERAAAVFVGTPVTGDRGRWVFRVDRVYKGDVAAEQAVRSAADGAACGLELVLGRRAVVFTRGGEADLCNGTREAALRPVPDSFGEPRAPHAGAGGGGAPWWPWAVAALAFAGAVAIVVRARIASCPPSARPLSSPS